MIQNTQNTVIIHAERKKKHKKEQQTGNGQTDGRTNAGCNLHTCFEILIVEKYRDLYIPVQSGQSRSLKVVPFHRLDFSY